MTTPRHYQYWAGTAPAGAAVPAGEAPAHAPVAATTTVIDTLAGLDALRPGWRGLDPSGSATAFQTFAWARTAAEEGGARGKRFAAIVVGPMYAPRLIWPLAIEDRLGVRWARWLGTPLSQYGDAVAGPDATEEDFAAAWQAVRALPVDLVLLSSVRPDATARPILERVASVAGPAQTGRYLDLGLVAADGFDKTVGKGPARRTNAAQRRLAKLGTLDFAVHDGAEARPHAETALALKRAWLEARGMPGATLFDEGWSRRLVELSGAPGGMVSVLSLDGEPAAIEIGFHHRGHYVAYLGAFRHELRAQSPGRVQMRHTIEWCANRGFGAYDLLPDDEPYKREWTTSGQEVYSYAYARTLAGRAALGLVRLRPMAKRGFYGLPGVLRRGAGRFVGRHGH